MSHLPAAVLAPDLRASCGFVSSVPACGTSERITGAPVAGTGLALVALGFAILRGGAGVQADSAVPTAGPGASYGCPSA